MQRAQVDDRVDGIEPEAIHTEVTEPLGRVIEDEGAHVVALASIEVQRLAPWRLVPIGEVRSELRDVVAVGAEVVVDGVKDDRDPAIVSRVDETAQRVRPAIRGMDGVQVDAVVTPTATARKCRERHELDGVDA